MMSVLEILFQNISYTFSFPSIDKTTLLRLAISKSRIKFFFDNRHCRLVITSARVVKTLMGYGATCHADVRKDGHDSYKGIVYAKIFYEGIPHFPSTRVLVITCHSSCLIPMVPYAGRRSSARLQWQLTRLE